MLMMSLAMSLMEMGADQIGAMAGVAVPVVGSIMLFGIFLPIAVWTGKRYKERAAYYEAETLRRITEASPDGAKMAIEMMREKERLSQIKRRESTKLTGMILVGVGIVTVFFMFQLMGGGGTPWLVGLIPALIGVAMLAYVYLLAAPIPELKEPSEE